MILISTETPNIGYIDTRIGGRNENQDNAGFVDTPYGLLVLVCDGMGGGPGGKTASATVVDVVMDVVSKGDPDKISCKEIMKTAISKSNEVLRKIAEENPSLRGMGTTIAAIIINEDQAVIAHVGDSRVYKVRGNASLIPFAEKVFRTQDHSMVGEMVRRGTLTEEQARLSSESNKITRAIGTQESVVTDIDIVPYEQGDRFLICSDGIWGAMPEKELVENACLNKSVSTVVERLTNLADNYGLKEGGHHDNLTIAIIETKNDSNIKENMNRKARRIIAGALGVIAICLFFIVTLLIKFNNYNTAKEFIQNEYNIVLKNSQELTLTNNDLLTEKEKLSKKIEALEKELNSSAKKTNAQNNNKFGVTKEELKELENDLEHDNNSAVKESGEDEKETTKQEEGKKNSIPNNPDVIKSTLNDIALNMYNHKEKNKSEIIQFLEEQKKYIINILESNKENRLCSKQMRTGIKQALNYMNKYRVESFVDDKRVSGYWMMSEGKAKEIQDLMKKL